MVDSKQQWKAWLYLSPAIVLLLIFTAWPIFNTLRMAFLENYNSMKEAGGATFEFGIGNFQKVIEYKNHARPDKPTKETIHEEEKVTEVRTIIDRKGLQSVAAALKSIQDIHGLKSEPDMREQEARINKLEKDIETPAPQDFSSEYQTLADMINNPKPNRNIHNFEVEDE